MSEAVVEQQTKEDLLQFVGRYLSDVVARAYQSDDAVVDVDYRDLSAYDPALADGLVDAPVEGLEHLEAAVNEYDVPVSNQNRELEVRVSGAPNEIEVGDLRHKHINELVSISGLVSEATQVLPRPTSAVFECRRPNCGALTEIEQDTDDLVEPHRCSGCEKNGPYRILTEKTSFRDRQKLSLQESPEDLRGGEMPEDIPVVLDDSLCAAASPGDRVTVTGVLRAVDNGGLPFEYELEANNVIVEDDALDDVELEPEDIDRIQELAERPDIYDVLRESFAPAIYGRGDIKQGILYQLFGAPKRDDRGSDIRGNIHILLVGDPGTAKSQLLRYAHKVTPRGVFTVGNGSTKAGLTATAVQGAESLDEGWTLKAGALPKGHKGLVCLDEMDKMDSDGRTGLNEALSDQQVSVSKAGISATFKAECSLLAASNPMHGRWDRWESIESQVDFDPTLLTRFDLIFVVKDSSDRGKNRDIARHMLKAASEDEVDEVEVDTELLRKYVSYARQNVEPTLSEEARQLLEDHYVEMKATASDDSDAMPISARHLEAMERLSAASARIRLSETISRGDAGRAIEIVEGSLDETAVDPETGERDVMKVENAGQKPRKPESQRERRHTLKEVIRELCEESEDDWAREEDILDKMEGEYDVYPSTTGKDLREMCQSKGGGLYEPRNERYRVSD